MLIFKIGSTKTIGLLQVMQKALVRKLDQLHGANGTYFIKSIIALPQAVVENSVGQVYPVIK